MSFPFKVGDKLKSPNAYKDGKRRPYSGPLNETRFTSAYMEITAIGTTLFLATYDHNEHVLSKLGKYELWDGVE